jgi:hypothetical protein
VFYRVIFRPEWDRAIIAGRGAGLTWAYIAECLGVSWPTVRDHGVNDLHLDPKLPDCYWPEHVRRQRRGMKQRWQQPEYRAGMLKARRRGAQPPALR